MTTPMQTNAFVTQVTLDASSTAVVEHRAGKVPAAIVVQPGRPGRLASIVPESYTDTSFRVKLNWHDGRLFPAGTIIHLAVIVAYEADQEPPVVGERCTLPIFKTSELRAGWTSPDNPNVKVLNEVWNTAEAGPQTIYVCNPSSWYVVGNHPKEGVPPERNGSIKSYPCTQVLLPNTAVSAVTSLRSSWAHETPADPEEQFEYNCTYDLWLNNFSREVMFWMDHQYNGSIPPSSIPAADRAEININGVPFTAWRRGNSKPGGTYIALVRQEKAAHGTIDLKAALDWLVSKGWLAASDLLHAVDYGFELADTKRTDQTFRLNDFQLQFNGKTIV